MVGFFLTFSLLCLLNFYLSCFFDQTKYSRLHLVQVCVSWREREPVTWSGDTPCMYAKCEVPFPADDSTSVSQKQSHTHSSILWEGTSLPCRYLPSTNKPQPPWQGLRWNLIKFMFAVPQLSSGKHRSFREVRLSYSCLVKCSKSLSWLHKKKFW